FPEAEARLHLTALSTRQSLAHIRAAKANLKVTSDVLPPYFTFEESSVGGFDALFKARPPLRAAIDLEAVKVAIGDGTVDAIASGHDPRRQDEKDLPFAEAAPGMAGLETALAATLTELD